LPIFLGFQGAGWGQGSARLSASTADVMLHIVNTSSGGRDFCLDSTGNGSGMGAGKFVIGDATAQSPRVTLDAVGNVGIGTSSPQSTLEVNGNIALSASSVIRSSSD